MDNTNLGTVVFPVDSVRFYMTNKFFGALKLLVTRETLVVLVAAVCLHVSTQLTGTSNHLRTYLQTENG